MKLSKQQVAAIRKKTGLKPLPEEAAEESGLAGAFGDQTFYVDPEGVYVFEPVEPPSGMGEPLLAIQIAEIERAEAAEEESESGDGEEGDVVLRPIQPRTTSLTVDLAA